jgi:hypothetical protein
LALFLDERFHDEFPGKKVSKFERKNIKISSSKRVGFAKKI